MPNDAEWIKKLYLYTKEYYATTRKDHAVCCNLDGIRGCHAEQNKQEAEKQIAGDLTHLSVRETNQGDRQS